jgi:hypothetical protein
LSSDQVLTRSDKRLPDQIMDAWVRFCGNRGSKWARVAHMAPYHVATDPYLEFGNSVTAKAGYRNRTLDFVQKFFDGKETAK